MIEHDALIVGAGGAGLWAAVELAKAGVDAAVLTKLYPTRSHTGAAQGGVCAALGNQEEDHWEWHMFDTIKGGDYLVDQDAAEILAREAVETVIELEHMGLPFNRTPDGKIDQRRFGGHTRNYGEGPVRRSCFAADRTGHMILQTLYQQAIKHGVRFYDEYHVVDLLTEGGDLGDGGRAAGVVAYAHRRRIAPHHPVQGDDARDRRLRADVPDHLERLVADRRRRRPGLPPRRADAGHGVLPVPPDRDRRDRHPAVRGSARRGRHPAQRPRRAVHGALRPDDARPGATRHGQPQHLPGDQGRPRHRRQGLRLPRRAPPRAQGHRGEAARHHRLRPGLPGRRADHRAGAHPADRPLRDGRHPDRRRDTRVTRDAANTVVPGLYAAGETACVSVHGANRLGTNSLVDLLVFGRRAGRQMAEDVKGCRDAGRGRRCGRAGPRRDRAAPRLDRPRVRAAHPRAAGRRDDGQRRRLSGRGAADRGPRPGRRAPGALRQGRDRRQGNGLQHRPAGGPRARLPPRLCRDHGRRRPGPQGEPRRPRPRGLPGSRRRELPDPHAWPRGASAARASATSRSPSPSSNPSPGRTDAGRPPHPPLRPRARREAALGGLPGRVRPEDGPRPGPAPSGQVRAGRLA